MRLVAAIPPPLVVANKPPALVAASTVLPGKLRGQLSAPFTKPQHGPSGLAPPGSPAVLAGVPTFLPAQLNKRLAVPRPKRRPCPSARLAVACARSPRVASV